MAAKPYIPELSEVQMIRRAPDQVVDFGPDREYIFSCVKDVENSFKVLLSENCAIDQVPARVLIKQLIEWWRTLEPAGEAQRDAYGRMPGAIRLIDTVSIWLSERSATMR